MIRLISSENLSDFFLEFLLIPPWSPRHYIALGLQVLLGLLLGYLEATGRFHLPYGKFRRYFVKASPGRARFGLALINLVPLLVYLGGYIHFGSPVSPYHNFLLGAFILIFGKRALTAAFLQRPSGEYSLPSLAGAAIAWSAVAWLATKLHNDFTSIYIVYDEPFRILSRLGFAVLLFGAVLSVWHQYLLVRLRDSSERTSADNDDETGSHYPLPTGGLFRFVVCPHYLGDILIWTGFAIMSRHMAMYGVAFIVGAYLAGRAAGTLRWYRLRESTPARLKSLLPFIF